MTYPIGKILSGDENRIRAAQELFNQQQVDAERLHAGTYPYSSRRTTLAGCCTVTGPGTFHGKALRPLTFKPSDSPGWWIERTDLFEQLPTLVSVRNVWTTARNIVLRSGNPHNYLRMVEHIIALRLGLGLDDAVVSVSSGDPPLFVDSSLPLLGAVNKARVIETDQPAVFVTVKEPVTIGGDRGDFITLLPAEKGQKLLRMDCAISWNSVIGKQRIRFDVTPETFAYGAAARTNASKAQMLYCRTFGKLFADTRNLGYTEKNILIHGRDSYHNEPLLIQPDGRTLEPVWHRAVLDLLAAVALIDTGRFVGTIISYRAGHALDVRLMIQLYMNNLLKPIND